MSILNSVTFLLNGLTLALSLSFLLIILAQDARRELNQLFALFLFMVMLWNVGSLLTQAVSFIGADYSLIRPAIGLMELGFNGSSIAIYVLTAVIIRIHTKRFRTLAVFGLLLLLVYQIIVVASSAPLGFQRVGGGAFTYQPQPMSGLFYLVFDTATFYLVWRYRRKIRSRGLISGILLFVTGQSLGLLNPELRALPISINISSLAALLISFAILRQQIITPLAERISQIEIMHKVSLAISRHISIQTVLNEIASQAAGWLDADAAGIFLKRDRELELATVYNLPRQFIHSRLALGQGIAGTVAETQQSIHVENYPRDWRGVEELPMSKDTFGSVVCVPFVYGGDVIGVLMVIAGKQGRLFNPNDVYLLELLASQAAVAIAHSQLFADEQEATREAAAARSQLETVLLGTENPVIAVDRRLRVIFVNPAATELFSLKSDSSGKLITDLLPPSALPKDGPAALRDLRRNRTHVYEVSLNGRTYLCNLARLGRPRTAGWVAVLNDVTQLKELDRLKSEMVRMTSHDLKNPLQAAMANVELLRDDLSAVEDVEIQQSIDVIEKQLDRMYRIINGILDLERIKSGAQNREICYPSRIVAEAVEELKHLAEDQGIVLSVQVAEDTPEFMGDHEQFKRALINLVENAIKFTREGGRVSVTAKRDEHKVMFEIVDTGIGIPRDLHTQVFERFFRGRQNGAEHISGSGLGLSLVKTIVENHDGNVWFMSEVGKGTTFFVTIPALALKQVVS